MPVHRLQPLPFPEPERFIDIVQEDTSLIEDGLRVVARRVPLPGPGLPRVMDVLALDASGRVTFIEVDPRLGASSLETATAAHDWIRENLPALRLLCPPLAGCGEEIRTILVGGRIEPALASLVGRLDAPNLELLEASLFQGAGGISVSLRRVGPVPSAPGDREAVPLGGTVAALRAPSARPLHADPLSGIPLSSEELAEFRSLAAPRAPKAAARRKAAPPEARLPSVPQPFLVVEN